MSEDYTGKWCAELMYCPFCATEQASVHSIYCERVECGTCHEMIPTAPVPEEELAE